MIMKRTNKAYAFLYCALLLIILQGCTTKKVIVSDLPLAGIEISEIIKNSRKTDLHLKILEIELRLNLIMVG